jgi:hypothetical protein
MVDMYMANGGSLEEFLDQYREKRKLAHMRRIKIDKMRELLAAKKVRQSASPTRSLPKVPEERVKTEVPTSLILGNIQKLASDMVAGVERIATEMSRHTRLLERQNDLLHRVTTAVLQVRDDMDRLRRRENRSSVKSVYKNIRK